MRIPAVFSETDASPPNIVFILAEDFGWGDLACYGHPYARTPNIDRLAKEGTMFMNFHVTGRTCAPSRTGFMTGRHPASYPNYMPDWTFQGTPTVTELLKGAGYVTGHIGKWHMGHDNDPPKGAYGIDYIDTVGPSNGHAQGKDFDVFTEAIKFIERNSGSSPFYLNVWTHIAHSPVDPHSSLVDEFKDVIVDRSKFGKHMQAAIDLALKYGGNLNTNMRNYLADVWSLDLQTGRLLQKLDDLGLRENTLVVFSADQGAAPPLNGQSNPQSMLGYAGGLRGGKHDFYEGGVRTSFVIRWPGHVPSGKKNEKSQISGLDWLPTLCAIARVPIDKTMFEGEDVSDMWRGSNRQRTNPLFFKTSAINGPKAILYDKWKFHNDKRIGKALYDLEANPEEDIDLRNIYPDIAKMMDEQLMLWESTLPTEYCLKKRKCTKMLPFDPATKPEVIGPPPLLAVYPAPTMAPTLVPTIAPTFMPVTPTDMPTVLLNTEPTSHPNVGATQAPTGAPTYIPTDSATEHPTLTSTSLPTEHPTTSLTPLPTEPPASFPTPSPTDNPTTTSTRQPIAITFTTRSASSTTFEGVKIASLFFLCFNVGLFFYLQVL